MTKSELLNDLSSKADVLDTNTPELVQTIENINKYDVPVVLDKGNNVALGASQPIIVIDEGDASESAYYNDKKVFSVAEVQSQLKIDAETYMDNTLKKKWGTGKLVRYDMGNVNEEKEFVRVTGYADDGSVSDGIVYYDDKSSKWTHQILN